MHKLNRISSIVGAIALVGFALHFLALVSAPALAAKCEAKGGRLDHVNACVMPKPTGLSGLVHK